jgi:anti-sigma factor RsiW
MKHRSHQPPPHEPPGRELLSAYFDGEVSAAERAEAERLLAEDPAAGAWLEELSDLRGQLQTLPRHRLGDEFSEQVLRCAARAMLPRTVDPAVDPPSAQRAARNGHVLENLRNEPNGHIGHALLPVIHRGAVAGAALDISPLPARYNSRNSHAPTWLAAAASLWLCVGLFFGASQREQSAIARADRQRGLVATHQVKVAEALPRTNTETSSELLGAAGRLEEFSASHPQTLLDALSQQAGSDKHVKADEGTEPSFAGGGHVLVVCDVAEPPAEAFGRFENWLRNHRLAKYALEGDEPAANNGNANKGKTPAPAVPEGKDQRPAESTTTRLYYVNVPKGELAQTLHNVALMANGEMSVSSLGVPLPRSEKAGKEIAGYTAGNQTAATKRALVERARALPPPQEPLEGKAAPAKSPTAAAGQVRAANRGQRGVPDMPPPIAPSESGAKPVRERRAAEAIEQPLAAAAPSSQVSVILVLRAAPPSALPSPPPHTELPAERLSK